MGILGRGMTSLVTVNKCLSSTTGQVLQPLLFDCGSAGEIGTIGTV
jgi:hypothetical protein